MIDMRYKPYFLPQVGAPFEEVLAELDKEGISYDIVEVNPDELNTSQGITFSDEVGNVDVSDDKPIWIGEDNQVLDGHHRWVRALLDNVPLKAIKIKMNNKDACRLLNKIQDIHDYKEAQQMEEVVGQDAINTDNDANAGFSDEEFLATLEEDNTLIQEEKPSTNQKTIMAYRKESINEKSVIGNFFTTSPAEGYNKYEIQFDNLLDINGLGVSYKDGQVPVDVLAKIWFPNVNFEKISSNTGLSVINLKNKAIASKAMKMGYDGIKYGELIQGLK